MSLKIKCKSSVNRDWDQFHNAKDLAIGISTEASEFLDLFRFKIARGYRQDDARSYKVRRD